MYRGAIVQQLSPEEEKQLRELCNKYNIPADKLLIAVINGLKEKELRFTEDEDGWKLVGNNTSAPPKPIGLLEKALPLLVEQESGPKEWYVTYHTIREPELPDSLMDLANILGLAEKGINVDIEEQILRTKLEQEGDYSDELDVATDALYDIADEILRLGES